MDLRPFGSLRLAGSIVAAGFLTVPHRRNEGQFSCHAAAWLWSAQSLLSLWASGGLPPSIFSGVVLLRRYRVLIEQTGQRAALACSDPKGGKHWRAAFPRAAAFQNPRG